MLYLSTRCVKGSVRYSKSSNFNQSADKRRRGTNLITLANNLYTISSLLSGIPQFMSSNHKETLNLPNPNVLVYLDPSYQGATFSKDTRYYSGITYDELINYLKILDINNNAYILIYAGLCANKNYGKDHPKTLNSSKILLNAGLSSQSTLLRKNRLCLNLYT